MGRCRGFTLIELLVVISIILILASITLPVVDQGLTQARKTECLNHLRQIGLAMQEYAIQHARHFPPHMTSSGGPHWTDAATEALVPDYLEDKELFYCPLAYYRYNPDRYWNTGWFPSCKYVWGYQYMGNFDMNTHFTLFPDDSIVPKVWGQERQGKPLALLQDNVWHSVSGNHYNGGHPGRDYDPRPPHDVNVFFTDGRAQNWRFVELTPRHQRRELLLLAVRPTKGAAWAEDANWRWAPPRPWRACWPR